MLEISDYEDWSEMEHWPFNVTVLSIIMGSKLLDSKSHEDRSMPHSSLVDIYPLLPTVLYSVSEQMMFLMG